MTSTSFHGSDRRHRLLRIVASIYSMIGGILLGLGISLLAFSLYTALATTISVPPSEVGFGRPQSSFSPLSAGLGATLSLLWSVGILLGALQFLATGALIRLMIQLDANTRATAQLLDRVQMRLEPAQEGTGSMFVA